MIDPADARHAEVFPTLEPAQIERIRPCGHERTFADGARVFEQGEASTETEIVALDGGDALERVTWHDKRTGEATTRPIGHVFMMTGASPNTEWLGGCVALDDKGFIKAGPDLAPADLAGWPLARAPYLFETSRPGVFAVGDARSASVKRVASAVGEGSICIQLVHKVLAE